MGDHGPYLVVGLGVTGAAVVHALRSRGDEAVVVDDAPGPDARRSAAALGVDLVVAPATDRLDRLVRSCRAVLPSPGVADRHPVFALAAERGVPIRSELDLAGEWDDRPVVAVTGTNGKTTVTELIRAMLGASGRAAVTAGNNELPLVAAIDDASTEVFVVEASSFRLLHSGRFAPAIATWLNVAPDHLDNHASFERYVAAKARIWADQGPHQVAIGNADDPIVAQHLVAAPARRVTFGVGAGADHHLDGDRLVVAGGHELARRHQLRRAFPHDVANALAAAASALAAGATLDGARRAVRSFAGLPHRVSLVGEAGGVRWFDDSKATAPHATLSALAGFDTAVLVAGGQNKGLDLGDLAQAADRIRAVVAIGAAAPEVVAAFEGVRPVRVAGTMDEAVALAADEARAGDAVLLSPACASFDWYDSYAERGDDFARAVREHLRGAAQEAAP